MNLPPRHLKSHCVSVAFIAWLLGHHPAKDLIWRAMGQDLADDLAAACQRVMRSSFYRALFGDLLGGRQAVNDFETVGGGRRLAVGGVLTGRGADMIVLEKSLANTRHAISDFSFASQYQQNPLSLEGVNAIDAERERRFSDAYHSNDQLTLGRLWHNRFTGTPEDEITDDQAMIAYQEWAAIVEKPERET
jgi:hypothetical protein